MASSRVPEALRHFIKTYKRDLFGDSGENLGPEPILYPVSQEKLGVSDSIPLQTQMQSESALTWE